MGKISGRAPIVLYHGLVIYRKIMKNTSKKSETKRRSAFTLVELIVVITILAILATVGFLALG